MVNSGERASPFPMSIQQQEYMKVCLKAPSGGYTLHPTALAASKQSIDKNEELNILRNEYRHVATREQKRLGLHLRSLDKVCTKKKTRQRRVKRF